MLLSRYKGIAFAQFHEKILQVRDYCLLKVGL